jgi:hypothetical protein
MPVVNFQTQIIPHREIWPPINAGKIRNFTGFSGYIASAHQDA